MSEPRPDARANDFQAVQRAYFEEACVERYRWTTSAPGFAESEDELLAAAAKELEGPCLEIGCGEGNNLQRLSRDRVCIGVDLFPRKLCFAQRELPHCRFAAADAGRLPFATASFRSVFVRDLLHHVIVPEAVLLEIVRVLAPGGRLCLLEPNARNPLVWLQTRLVPAEAGARRFSPEHVRGLLEGLPIDVQEITTRQPLPLRRSVLHYAWGLPRLGRLAPARALLGLAERWLGGLLPRSRWTYVEVRARRR